MNTTSTDTASARIAAAMKTAERSSKWTAEKSGIPETTFRRKVSGHVDFTVTELDRIARALSVSPLDLLPASMLSVAA